MLKKIVILMIVSVIGLGCEAENLNLFIRFDHIDGLKSKDSVIFETNRIGKVGGVTYTKKGDYLVELMIHKAYTNAVTEHARFFVKSSSIISIIFYNRKVHQKIFQHPISLML